MNSENIKEILDDLLFTTTLPNVSVKLSEEKLNQLIDYITNLQEELERYKHYFKTSGIEELMEENEMYSQLKDEYEDIIEKAIEYINKYPCETWYYAKDRQLILRQDELLNILQGVGKDD